jgi:hypothetical protein
VSTRHGTGSTRVGLAWPLRARSEAAAASARGETAAKGNKELKPSSVTATGACTVTVGLKLTKAAKEKSR